jgi:hypothetical protein
MEQLIAPTPAGTFLATERTFVSGLSVHERVFLCTKIFDKFAQ